jgi:hypothetical protein
MTWFTLTGGDFEKVLELYYSDGIGVGLHWISLSTDSAKIYQVFVPWWNFGGMIRS